MKTNHALRSLKITHTSKPINLFAPLPQTKRDKRLCAKSKPNFHNFPNYGKGAIVLLPKQTVF